MTGYVPPQKKPILGIATDNVNADLANLLKVYAQEYCDIEPKDVQCGYGCSDHYSWYKAGYPSVFSFEAEFDNHSPYIHSSQDVVEKIDFEHVEEFVKLVLAYAVELSLNLEF